MTLIFIFLNGLKDVKINVSFLQSAFSQNLQRPNSQEGHCTLILPQ